MDLGMALAPEGGRVFRGLTVQENLRLGAYRQTDEQAVQSQLEAVFELFPVLAERRRPAAHMLNNGEQQMLAIGRPVLEGTPAELRENPRVKAAYLGG